jgi:hypothetical protein
MASPLPANLERPLLNPCGHLRNSDTGRCVSVDPCNGQAPGPEEAARRRQLVSQARSLIGALSSRPGALEHHLQVLVALGSHLENTASAIRTHADARRLPQPELADFMEELEATGRQARQRALTLLALLSGQEVRHG